MKVSVIGAGSWGTAVAWLLSHNGSDVTLWCHSADQALHIRGRHRNPRYLSDVDLSGIEATSSFEDAARGASALVLVTPSSAVRETLEGLAPHVGESLPVVMLSKGIERETG
ncbi:MAG: 2-dehydropantoate 2-reductase N-terminal domain-containing protein, partial [Coriobacteriales bacterium]